MKDSVVYLVGAGPGDPDLISVKGLKLISVADAIVYDRLVDKKLLDHSRSECQLVYVGKSPGGSIEQKQINKILVDLAKVHRITVRLKGGDPYIFGRGGEEVLALKENNIKVEVIPGISSATSGPLLSGIPLTHRSVSAAFTVVTGSTSETEALNYKALAELNSTIVVLMGVANRKTISDELIRYGRMENTPVAVIRWASYEKQEVMKLTLKDLGDSNITPPAVIVIGDVAGLSLTDN